MTHVTGLSCLGLRASTCCLNHAKMRSLPLTSRPSIGRVSSARTSLCCGTGRFSLAFWRITSSTTSAALRTKGSMVYTDPTHAIRFLLAFSHGAILRYGLLAINHC